MHHLSASPAPLFIVLNAGADRRRRERALEVVEQTLAQAGRRFEILRASRGSDVAGVAERAVARAAAAEGIVVGAGGDGTLNAIVQPVIPAGVRFGVLPLGTFNYFARAHAIPLDTHGAIDVLLRGETRAVDVGWVNGRFFLVNASLGFYPMLLEDREAFKREYGRSRVVAALAAIATLLLRRQPRLSLAMHVGGETRVIEASTLFVGNNALQLERVGLAGQDAVHGDGLAAVCVRARNTWELLLIALRGALGRLAGTAAVDSFAFRDMRVSLVGQHVTVRVATDGETTRMSTPLTFRGDATPLRLVCPGAAAP